MTGAVVQRRATGEKASLRRRTASVRQRQGLQRDIGQHHALPRRGVGPVALAPAGAAGTGRTQGGRSSAA